MQEHGTRHNYSSRCGSSTETGAGLIYGQAALRGREQHGGQAGHLRLATDGRRELRQRRQLRELLQRRSLLRRLGRAATAGWRAACGRQGTGFLTRRLNPAVTTKGHLRDAQAGDRTAQAIVWESAAYLGMGLSILIDPVQPERIVIDSIFARAGAVPAGHDDCPGRKALAQAAVCRVVPRSWAIPSETWRPYYRD